jgi:predicted MFS family arabinose efflux permease
LLTADSTRQTNQVGDRNIRLYLTGLTASMLGDSAMSLVAGIWVKQLTGNRAAALVSVCVFVPSVLAPLAGAVVDRFPRRRVLLAVNAAAATVVLLLLFVRGASQAWLIYAVMLWYGATLVVIDPAETALFTQLTPEHAFGQLNGVRVSPQEGCKLLAPLGGAALFAAAGGAAVAAVEAGTFALAVGTIALLRFPERRPQPTERHWRTEVAAGLLHVRGTPELARLTAVGGIAMIASGVAFAAQYPLVDALHRPAPFLGVLTSALGAGSIAAGLTSGRVLARVGERGLVTLGLINGAAGYLLTASGCLPAVLAGAVVRGFALPWIVIAVITAGRRLTPWIGKAASRPPSPWPCSHRSHWR